MNRKTISRFFLGFALLCVAYRPLMNVLPLGPKPLNEAVSSVKRYAQASETFGILGFSKGKSYSATEWVNQFLSQQPQLLGLPKEVIFLDRSLETDQAKKVTYESIKYQLTLTGNDEAHTVSVSAYKDWIIYPLFTKSIPLPVLKASEPPNSYTENQAPYDLESGIIIFDVNTETTGPDSLNLGLEKKMIFRKGGLEEIQEHKGGMDWKGIRDLHFRTVTRGEEQFTTRFYESAHRRYRAKHARLLRFDAASLQAAGALSTGSKAIQKKICQILEIPSSGVSYCVWKGIPLEIREKINGQAVIHTAVGIEENAAVDASLFEFKAAEEIGTPEVILSEGSVTKQFMEQLLSEIV